MAKIRELIGKYRSILLYAVFGALTTLVDFLIFWLMKKVLGIDAMAQDSAAYRWACNAANLTGNGQGGDMTEQPGNSVSGNTTVGDGTATIPDGSDGSPAPTQTYGEGYGYLGVEGGLFDRISSGYDRINAYIARYGDLLCRLTVEDGAVTKIAVCSKDNL